MYAYITTGENTSEQLAPLTIGKGSVGFFISPLKRYCQFCQQRHCPDTWELTFFKKTEFATSVTIRFMENPLPNDDSVAKLSKAKAAWFNNDFNSDNNEKFALTMSQFLRGSAALSIERLKPTTHNRHLINDRSGLAYFSGSADQFKRIVLCQALVVAYSQVLSSCVEQLTKALKSNAYEGLPTLYEQILFFNASDYFSHPVSLDRHELFTAWNLMRDHWHLNELNNELTSQLAGVASLLKEQRDKRLESRRLDEEKRQQRRDKEERETREAAEALVKQRDRKMNRIVTAASLLLGVISLISFTPEDLVNAYQSWLAPLFN